MAGPLFHVGAQALCPHGGQIAVMPGNSRVTATGQPVATMADTTTVAGCAFTVGTVPSPCVMVRWITPAARVRAGGQSAILQTSPGFCQSAAGAPQGAPIVVSGQVRVRGA